MKQSNNTNRAFCWLMALVLAMLPTMAQGNRQLITTLDGKQNCLTSRRPNIKLEQKGSYWVQKLNTKAQQKTEATEETVTVTYEWDFGESEDIEPEYFFSLNQEARPRPGQTQVLKHGVYDLIACARQIVFDSDNNVTPIYYFVLKEEISINQDTTIVFNLNEATQQIQIHDHHPNGELFTKGNYGTGMSASGLCRKNDGAILDLVSVVFDRNQPLAYINPVSDRFSYYQGSCYISNDWEPNPEAYATFYVNDDLSQPLESNAEDYHLITEHFIPSKVSQNEAEAKGFGGDLFIMNGDETIIGFGLDSWTQESECDVKLYVNLQNQSSDFNGLYALVRQSMIDYLEVVDYFPWGMPMYDSRYIYTPRLTINQDEVIYLNLGANQAQYGTQYDDYFLNDGNKVSYPYARGPHPFFYSQAQKLQDFGSGVPIFVYLNFRGYGTGGSMIGRYGEYRQVDDGQTSLCLKKNGEQVWQGGIKDYGQYDIYEQEPLGIIEGIFTNDNVIVDDLQGLNLTTIHYDEQLENDIPPMLTMLWFKDTEGNATDHFSNGADGLLEFSAGDFIPNVNLETYNMWYTCQAMNNVEVCYSPYQQDDWNELAVEEVPENFCSPGYGYFYRGSLADVTGEALKGWFDLKVKLTDAAGNWQEQIISPAFRIDDLAYTSVANVGSDNAREVARYSIDGKRVNASHRGVTIIKLSDGTAKKVIQ